MLRAGRNLIFVEAEVVFERKEGGVVVAKTSSMLAVTPLNAERGEEQMRWMRCQLLFSASKLYELFLGDGYPEVMLTGATRRKSTYQIGPSIWHETRHISRA